MSLTVLEDSIIYLLHSEPFYAHLLMRCRRIQSTKIETAGVRITDGIDLFYNEKFLLDLKSKYGIKAPAGVLKHEMEHILFLHLGQRQEGFEPTKFNIAADCSINQFNALLVNSDIKEKWVTLDSFKELVENPKVEAHQTLEYYYGLLQKKAEEKKGDPEFQKMLDEMSESLDDHGTWDASVCSEAQKRVAQYAVTQAAATVGRGNIPGHLQKPIEAMNKETLNWKSILRRFWSRGVKVEIKSSRMRVNRRYGIQQPGKRTNPLVSIAAVIDTSASMSDKDIDAIFCELKRAYDAGATVHVIECDTEVHKIWEYQGKNNVEVHGRGGTSFAPGLEAAAKLDCDLIVYATDADGESDFKRPNCPILWLLTREGHTGSLSDKDQKIWMKTE